nr:MAG TPA: hypothetical protein [Bacteriophage sp.]
MLHKRITKRGKNPHKIRDMKLCKRGRLSPVKRFIRNDRFFTRISL